MIIEFLKKKFQNPNSDLEYLLFKDFIIKFYKNYLKLKNIIMFKYVIRLFWIIKSKFLKYLLNDILNKNLWHVT